MKLNKIKNEIVKRGYVLQYKCKSKYPLYYSQNIYKMPDITENINEAMFFKSLKDVKKYYGISLVKRSWKIVKTEI